MIAIRRGNQRPVRIVAAMLMVAVTLLAGLFATTARADVPAAGDFSPSVWSDKLDYAPGEHVTLHGSHWQPGESVHITVNDDTGATWNRDVDVTANDFGDITDEFDLPNWFVATYNVKSTGSSGSVATSSFTDGNFDFQLATAATTNPTTWTVGWQKYTDGNCTTKATGANASGSVTYNGNSLISGTRPGASTTEWFKPTSVTASGYQLSFWSAKAGDATATAPDCLKGNNGNGISTYGYAHFERSTQKTSLTVESASGTYGGTAALSAHLTTAAGTDVAGKTVVFSLNGKAVGIDSTDTGGVATLPNASLSGIDAGTYAAGTNSGVSATFSDDAPSPSYEGSSASNSLTVDPKTVTGGFTAQDKVYDGARSATVTPSPLAGTGTDDVSLRVTNALFDTKNAGAGKTVTGDLALAGAKASNYRLSAATATATASITTRPITVTADAKTKTYGEADPQLTYTVTDGSLVDGERFSGDLVRAAGEDVGAYAIRQGSLTAGGNYELTFVGAELTITKKALTVSGAKALDRAYDGTVEATVSYADATLVGVVGQDAVEVDPSVDGYKAEFADANAGTGIAVSVTGLGLKGPAAGNYSVAAPEGLAADITKRPVTVTADAKTKTYREADPQLTYTVTDGSLIDGDRFSGDLAREAGEDVGAHAINQGTLTAGGNYELTFVGADLTITKRAITVAADAKSKTYGEADPELTYRVTDGSLVTGDTFVGGLTREAGEDAGGYAIRQGSLSAGGNYELTFVGADLTINPRAIAVTADDKTKVLGAADPALTYNVTSGSMRAGDGFTGTLTRAAGENVGSYAIQQGTLSAGGNYAMTFVPGTLTIRYAPAGATCGGVAGHTILQPINADGTSVFKQGSTVPAKFTVCGANGAPIGTPGVVTSFMKVGVKSGTEVTTVNETAVSTTPDTAFRWSASDQQWIFNINTKTLTAGKTYLYRVALADGTNVDFQFGLK